MLSPVPVWSEKLRSAEGQAQEGGSGTSLSVNLDDNCVGTNLQKAAQLITGQPNREEQQCADTRTNRCDVLVIGNNLNELYYTASSFPRQRKLNRVSA